MPIAVRHHVGEKIVPDVSSTAAARGPFATVETTPRGEAALESGNCPHSEECSVVGHVGEAENLGACMVCK